MSDPTPDEIVAVWETDYGWAAVIPDWQLDLEISPDGSRSIVDANSIEPSFISYWRRTVPGKIPAPALAKMILMASRSRGMPVSHYFLREEPRRIEREEFVQIVESFAAAMKRERDKTS